ncbi:MAG: TolC family protein [Hungatella sp.]|nr:TolC family protein [Hungatella sp.]
MRRTKMISPMALGVAVSLSLGMPVSALAGSPEFSRTAEEWARLRDNVLEYGEIEDLVYEYNTTVLNNAQAYNRENNRDRREVVKGYMDQAADALDAYTYTSSPDLLVAANQAEQAAENNVLEGDRTASMIGYKQTEKGIAKQAQEAMNTYFRLQYQLTALEKERELLAATVGSVQGRQSQGMATYAEVLNAQQSVQGADSQIIAMKSQIEDTRQNLIITLGWKQGDMPEIRPMPQMQMDRISAMNVEEDTRKALAADYTLQLDQRKMNNSITDSNKNIYKKTVEEDKQKIAVAVNDGYQKVIQAKNSYDEAVLNLEVETKNWNAANTKYQLGSISRMEWMQAETALVKARMDREVRNLELFQAMENYDWIIKGVR